VKIFRILIVAIPLLFLLGCRTAPIQNVDNAAVVASTHKKLTANQVKNTIIRSGNELGWSMNPVKPGLVVGTLNLRGHQAIVSIPYTASNFSIKYKSSENLKHHGNMIHSNYNGWVRNLYHKIQTNLSAAA